MTYQKAIDELRYRADEMEAQGLPPDEPIIIPSAQEMALRLMTLEHQVGYLEALRRQQDLRVRALEASRHNHLAILNRHARAIERLTESDRIWGELTEEMTR